MSSDNPAHLFEALKLSDGIGIRLDLLTTRRTLGTFFIFGVGMLFLGLFAAFNYESVMHREPIEFTVSSATMAIDAAKKATPDTQNVQHIASVDLIPGAGGNGSSSAVWHAVLETRRAQLSAISPSSAPSVFKPARRPRAAAKSTVERSPPFSSSAPRVDVGDTSAVLQRADY